MMTGVYRYREVDPRGLPTNELQSALHNIRQYRNLLTKKMRDLKIKEGEPGWLQEIAKWQELANKFELELCERKMLEEPDGES